MTGIRILIPTLIIVCGVLLSLPIAAGAGAEMTERARKFVERHEAKVRPLEVTAALAWSSRVTSTSRKRARPPSFSASASPEPRFKSAMTALPPFARIISTVAAPSPEAPPVMMNVLLRMSISLIL